MLKSSCCYTQKQNTGNAKHVEFL